MTNIDLKKRIEDLAQLSYSLKSCLLKDHGEQKADSIAEQVEDLLLQDNVYLMLFDEAILADVLHALHQYYDSEPLPDVFYPVENQLILVRKLHSNIQAVLDSTLSIETLLYELLNRWPLFENELDYDFEQSAELKLQKIRANGPVQKTLEKFFEVFFETLHDIGYAQEVQKLNPAIQQCISSFERLSQSTLRGLFIVNGEGEVADITIKASSKHVAHSQTPHFLHAVDANMTNAAARALSCANDIEHSLNAYNFEIEISRPYVDYGGNSIGLALGVGYITEVQNIPVSPYIGFTGHLEFKSGKVTSIQGVEKKVKAAIRSGIREVFISVEDKPSLPEDIAEQILIHPVETLRDVINNLKNRTYEIAQPSLESKIRKVQNRLSKYGFTCKREDSDKYIRLNFWNGVTVPVTVYHTHRYTVGGSSTLKHKDLVDKVFKEIFEFTPTFSQTGREFTDQPKTDSSIADLDKEQRQRVKDYIQAQDGVSISAEQHCEYAAKIIQGNYKLVIKQYNKGLLFFQGKDDPLFDKFYREIEQLLGIIHLEADEEKKTPQTKLSDQQAAVMAIDVGQEWVGTDESGKGDYFGPLVSAAVYITQQMADSLNKIGVTDSKKLSDKRIDELAPAIEKICGNRCTKVILNPEKYNELYSRFQSEGKNLNSLLAWMHVRALENILPHFQPISPLTVIVDKFADENYIRSRFKEERLIKSTHKVELRLVQLPKAEINVAVAAASIIARYYFLQQLKGLSKTYGLDLPKGASDPQIIGLGKTIIGQYGASELSKVAKLHFRTTGGILNG